MTAQRITAIVTKTGRGGSPLPGSRWRVALSDGTILWAAIHARIRTLKTPTLQVGDTISGTWVPGRDSCSINHNESPVVWVTDRELERLAHNTQTDISRPNVPACPKCGIFLLIGMMPGSHIQDLKSQFGWLIARYDDGVPMRSAHAAVTGCVVRNCPRCKTNLDTYLESYQRTESD